jgi:KDO2-lipid IV(A) lauroyltransferase
MAKPHHFYTSAVHFAGYIGMRLAATAMHSFPIQANLRFARRLGDFAFLVDRKHRERAIANLKRSFPDMPDAQRREMARRSMQELFLLIVEVLFTTRLIRLDTWAEHVEMHGLQPVLEMLLRRKKGMILITGHYGNFEVLGYVMAILGFATSSVARPLDNAYVSRWLFDVRQKHGQRIIAKKGATAEVISVLDDNGVVGFVADQNAGRKGLFVDFFGRKASTYKSIGLLAMEYEVPIVVGYSRRLSDDFRFRMGVEDIIWPADWKNEDDPLRYITQRYTKAIEDFIRASPDQYWWLHRRWKSRPKGEEPEAYD